MPLNEETEIILSSPLPLQPIPDQSFGEYFINSLSQFEDKIVIYDAKTDETLTAKQLIEKSHNVAVALLNRGIIKSDIILYYSENLIEYAITQIAIYLLGNAFTASKHNNGVYELSEQIKDSGANVIFTSLKRASITDKVLTNDDISKRVKLVVIFDGKHSDHLSFNELLNDGYRRRLEKVPHFQIDLTKDIFMIGYTSGTTGLPKGSIWSNKAFISMILHEVFVTNNTNISDIFGCHYPFTHIMGTYLFPKYLLMGNAVVIIDMTKNEDLFEAIEKYKITRIGVGLSFGFQLLDDSVTNKYDLSSLKYAISGGTPFPPNLVQPIIDKYKLQCFTHIYGMTEYGAISMNSENDNGVYIPRNNGYLTPILQLKIRDIKSDISLGPNQLGELCVRSVVCPIFSGYLNNPKATKASIDENGWYFTGDIGYYDENGRLFITDRIKELIKYSSYSIAPAEIENFLLTHEAIEDVVVVGVPHPIDNQWLRAYVVIKKNKTLTEQEVLNYVSDNMGLQKQLRSGVVFVDKIVKTLIGKIDRTYYRKLVGVK